MAKKPRGLVYVKLDWCKECGFCIEFCPFDILKLDGHLNAKGYRSPVLIEPERCTGCDLCGMICPEFAIWSTRIPV